MNTNNSRDKYEHPLVAVDMVVFTIVNKKLNILLIQRAKEPFKNYWAIPGGLVERNESLEEAAIRELVEETSVKDVYLEQLQTFGDVKRDPRGRIISVAFLALISPKGIKISASSDAKEVNWFSVEKLPKLAFDHKIIVNLALNILREKIQYSDIVYPLLRNRFRLSELQEAYEVIMGGKLDKRNFRKRLSQVGLVKSTGQKELDGAHRPAMLHQFRSRGGVFK